MPADSNRTQPAARRANPKDFTGLQKQRAEEAVAEERALRETELATASRVEAERRVTEVVDYTKGGHQGPAALQPAAPQIVHPDLVESEVEVGPREVTIRVNTKIEDMVFAHAVTPPVFSEDGKITTHAVDHGLQFYTFEEGVQYKVPIELARHLDGIGYLYH